MSCVSLIACRTPGMSSWQCFHRPSRLSLTAPEPPRLETSSKSPLRTAKRKTDCFASSSTSPVRWVRIASQAAIRFESRSPRTWSRSRSICAISRRALGATLVMTGANDCPCTTPLPMPTLVNEFEGSTAGIRPLANACGSSMMCPSESEMRESTSWIEARVSTDRVPGAGISSFRSTPVVILTPFSTRKRMRERVASLIISSSKSSRAYSLSSPPGAGGGGFSSTIIMLRDPPPLGLLNRPTRWNRFE
mmetsp:Transcript_15153/g.37147  ORF Transcript_15153/g.37147 Transcript_15153/m.37147 type:complete len:249 (-) Transcript_15153:231-977(-)